MADVELHPNVSGDFVQPGVGLRAHYEAASGDIEWQRAELSLSGRKYFGPVSLAAHADGGLVLGRAPPPQKLFELGGQRGVAGLSSTRSSPATAPRCFRTFASYRFDIWRRPVDESGEISCFPGLSPGFAVSAQGGWTELSSSGAKRPPLRLVSETVVPLSTPTDGVRATIGAGITLFSDLLHLGVARPVDRPAPWKFVVGYGGRRFRENPDLEFSNKADFRLEMNAASLLDRLSGRSRSTREHPSPSRGQG